MNFELVGVVATHAEATLLGCLEKLFLRRIARLAPRSDVGMQAEHLLKMLEKRTSDHSWRFPNKGYLALCQQASGMLNKNRRGSPGGLGERVVDDHGWLMKLINLAFAVDEIGGEATWGWVLDYLEEEEQGSPGCHEDGGALADTLRVLREYLSRNTVQDETKTPVGTTDGAVGKKRSGRVSEITGSKLEAIAVLLREHMEKCTKSGFEFSALVFVSTRDLATATPEMLEAVPFLKPFVKAQHVVGLSEMSLSDQHSALDMFRRGPKNVLVSTSVCGEGIDVPACGLVVCASLPNSGISLVQLRGRIRCDENCRRAQHRRVGTTGAPSVL